MKKIIFSFAVLAMSMAMFTSCSDDEAKKLVEIASINDDNSIQVVVNNNVTLAPNIKNADANTSYSWEDGAGNVVGTDATYAFTPVEAGTYKFTLKVITSDGRTASKSFYVVVTEDIRTITFEGDEWTSLIPDGQAYGVATLIYGEDAINYLWTDAQTQLQGGLTLAWGGIYGFAEGGTVVSNYIDANVAEHASSDYQLSVPVSNGSNNFAVVYCDASIQFPEGESHVVKSMDIAPTTYLLGEMKNGGYGKALTEEGDYFTLTLTADNGNTLDIDLARDGEILEEWKTFDLSSLGAVNKISFAMDGSDRSSYGAKHPKYFAFDNVVVKF